MGAKALPRTHAAMAAAAVHATGRQRREGSDPVGKSSRTKITNPKPTKNSQPSQLPQARVGGNRSSNTPMVANA